MKRLLAICSILFTVCATFTACGSGDTTYDSNSDSSSVIDERSHRDDSIKDHAEDAVDGVGEAGEELIEGATDAAGDIIDGLDGEDDSSRSHRTTTTSRRNR